MPTIGGYGVHAAKLRRAGVPVLTGHTILRAEGGDSVERAVIAAVDEQWRPLPESEQVLEVDTICLAVSLSPLAELASMAEMAGGVEIRFFGGYQDEPYERQASVDLIMVAQKQ